MFFCFVFGLEPWLLPPAVEMVEALKSKGHRVQIIYAQYRGENPDPKDYDTANTYNIIPKQGGYKRLLTYTLLTKAVEELRSKENIEILIACDIVSLQAISGITGIKKGYWGFEIFSKPRKVKLSFDYYRSLRFPAWIRGLNFYLAPSRTRVDKIRLRAGNKVEGQIIYNCRRYVKKGEEATVNKSTDVIYTGRISAAQYVEEIVDAIELVSGDIKLYIAGPGDKAYIDKLQHRVDTSASLKGRVIFTGRLSREDVYALTEKANIGFVFYNDQMGDEANDPAPNKLSDYIAAGIWSVGGPQGYIKYWLEERGAGICIKEVNKENIAAAISAITAGKQFQDKRVLQDIYKNELNMDVQCDKLLQLIERT